MKTRASGKFRFLSLFWKTIIAVSIATLTASSGIVFVGKLTLEKNYSTQRLRAQRFFQKALDSTLQRSKRQEVNIGWLIPAFIDPQADNQQALQKINSLISKNWFKVELESDIQSTLLFKHDKTIINQWGIPHQTLEDFDPWLDYVIENEQPIDRIKCHETCIHYFVRPFLHQGEFIGVFIFGIDLSEIILQMKDVTGAGIGVLVNDDKNQDKTDKKSLAVWSKKLMSLTDFDRNRALINKFMQLNPEIPEDSVFIDDAGKQFEFTFLPLRDNENQATLLVIDDISEQREELQKAQLLYLANGLISLVLSGGILLILFIKPMRRIRVLISSLPLIAKKQYGEAEKNMLATNSRRIKDEIDILGDATHDLLLTSKQLDEEINQHTQDLSERSEELQQEQNFIKHILNTAQVIILTMNQKGDILTLNKYTENLTGFKFQELLNQTFYTWMLDPDVITDISKTVSEFGYEHRRHYQKDCLIVSATGEELYISWFFTLLDNHKQHPEILAVGLDLSDRKKVENQLLWLADHDSLTNLFNRRRFDKELQRALAQANRYHESGAIVFFDIDHFKNINDSSGHQFGDRLLIKVAKRLCAITRDTDIIARLGGDEFVVLAQHVSPQQAEELVTKICLEMSLLKIRTDDIDLRITISAGLLVFPVANATDYSNLDIMASVDIAMYKAKSLGRGRWSLASTTDLERSNIKQRVNWKAKIESALDDNRLVLYYQPIMKIADKSISHYECLLRMIGEHGEIIAPGLFMDVAVQTGLMNNIDVRVLELAFASQASFDQQGKNIKLTINLSGDFISKPDSFHVITTLLKKWQVSANRIIFEVTESQAVTNLHTASELMQNFSDIGGQFALDDFGVGFSSLNYLKRLPVHYLKIDGSFVKNLSDSREDHLFVNAINSVGQGMELITIAEFVENDQILEILSKLKVDYAQGYAIGKPAPEPVPTLD